MPICTSLGSFHLYHLSLSHSPSGFLSQPRDGGGGELQGRGRRRLAISFCHHKLPLLSQGSRWPLYTHTHTREGGSWQRPCTQHSRVCLRDRVHNPACLCFCRSNASRAYVCSCSLSMIATRDAPLKLRACRALFSR